MSHNQASLLDMARAADLILAFKQDVDKEMFHNDIKTQSAILHQLLIMGEAVKRLSMPFREAHPEIDWKSIAGLRDILIHGYDIVDLDLVWVIAEEQVPKPEFGNVLAGKLCLPVIRCCVFRHNTTAD